ncbi:sugar lactone lactonase YvrE [Nocardia tenerifensis]|uniref:Sugar lactone lactonase YvrE n=1 Tax=Nocardia tenerifensis TaxID=228006 RepID=A0A318KBT2_9NOCA|nr:SMP-30/gluconolactonase/LRE family protein [Nocardia tenerifensis]PXX71347.1 sugar lactone lactonase YvrE [Nocardia tenerifensis]
MKRRLGVAAALAGLAAAALAPAVRADGPVFPATIALPAGFRPEGIAIGTLPVAYLGSMADGSIYRADLVTGQGGVFSRGPGTPALGLQLDHLGRLFVAGGTGGDVRVVDAGTGATLATYPVATQQDTFVNDIVLTPTGAWITDSRAPVLYHLPLGPDGALPRPEEVRRIPLTGDIAYVPGEFNANGIVRTPDGSALIVVQSVTGLLFRVDPATGATRRIDLGPETLPDGDGLLLDGRTLYAVENRSNAIAVIALSPDGATGTVERRITDPRFDVPTTLAAFGDRLYLPNARFDTPPEPTTPYNAVAVDRTR